MDDKLKILVILISFTIFYQLHLSTSVEASSYKSMKLISSEKMDFLKKAYPYEYKTIQYQKYIILSKTKLDLIGQILDKPISVIKVFSLHGPMNSSWPMKSFNAQRIGRTASSTADNPGLEKWRFQTRVSGVDSGAAITEDGTIIFGSNDFRIYALYPNGTIKWEYITGQPILSDPALAADGTIYIASCDWYLYALYSNGLLKWKFDMQYLSFSSPVLSDNGTIYISTAEGKLFAINPNGTSRWCYDAMSGMYGDPSLGADGSIYIGTWDNYLNAINPNGTLKWRFHTGNHVKGVPSVAPDNSIYFGSWDGYLYALYPNGTMRWRCRVGSGTETTPAIAADGTIYVGGDDLYAVYPNGTMRWIFDIGEEDYIFTSCPAIAAEGTIYVGVNHGNDVTGYILAVNSNGTERWRKIISDESVDSSPAIGADGTIYIGSSGFWYGSALHAFNAVESNAPPTSPIISGPTEGKAGKEYGYLFTISDPDNNPVQVFVDWDDGTNGWSYETSSGDTIKMSHIWNEDGTYTIKVKGQDTLGTESNWTTMVITMPFSYEPQFPFIQWLLERFPNAFPILRYILNY